MTNITKRFEALLSFVPKCKCIADIGSDHGKLSVLLLKNQKAKKIIATDISAKSLQKTIDLVQKLNLVDKIDCRLGNGLEPIKSSEADCIVIAGLGGREIANILSSPKAKSDKIIYVLQPVQSSIYLREFLNNNNFVVNKDKCIFENGKYYDILKVRYNSLNCKKLSKSEILFGKSNLKTYNQDFIQKVVQSRERLLQRYEYLNKDDYNQLKMIDKILEKFKGKINERNT